MKITKIILVALAPISISSLVYAEDIKKIPRENGAVHREFRSLIGDYIQRFESGVGRISLVDRDDCNVDFYTNKETTFVTMDMDDGDFYNEFYIDHPTQSFRKILFQNLITHDSGKELKVVKRDEGYSILRDGQILTLTTKTKNGEDSKCTFDLAKASFYEGQTE